MRAASLLFMIIAWLGGAASAVAQNDSKRKPWSPRSDAPQAAGTKIALDKRPMEVLVVTHAGPCTPDCPRWIAAQGEITSTTPDRFRAALAVLNGEVLPVVVDSSGGSVLAAMEIGRMIRRHGLAVVVGRTAILGCAAGDVDCREARSQGQARGRIQLHWSTCISACPLILAGGIDRFVGEVAAVGVHELTEQFTSHLVQRSYRHEKTGLLGPSERKLVGEKVVGTRRSERPAQEGVYALVSSYLEEMGVSTALVPLMKSKRRSEILVLTPAQVRQTELATEEATGYDVLRGVVGPRSPVLPRLMSCDDDGRCLPDLRTFYAPAGRGRVMSPGLTIVF